MDWLLLIGLLICIFLIGAGVFYWRGFAGRIRDEFHAQQPALRVTNVSTLNAGEVVTLTLDLENVGHEVAYDCVLQLSGWDGNFTAKTIHPPGSRYQRHSIPIVLPPHGPIRTKLLSRCSVRVAWCDRWELRYECWYPISQVRNIATGLYNVHVNLSEPELTLPHPSLWDMWKFLRRDSSND
jgi:hypothetical protein